MSGNLYARTVFFTNDAPTSYRFYTEQLGFHVDWEFDEEGKVFVFQVSLKGFELILNQTWGETLPQAGHGRVFIGLEDDQLDPLREHFRAHPVPMRQVDWGRPTWVIDDPDGNEIFFWTPGDVSPGIGSEG